MSLLTPAEVQAFGVGLALSTTDLQTIIDLEEAELVRRFGSAAGARAETPRGGDSSLFLKRAISSITSIAEYYYLGDTAPQTLVSTDYFVWGEEGRLERVNTACKWGAYAVVTYTPVDDTSLRKVVLLELIRIATEEATSGSGNSNSVSGLSFSIGASSNSNSTATFANQRATQYARLGWLSR